MEAGKGLGQARDSGRIPGDRLFADIRPGGPRVSESLNLKGQREGVLIRIFRKYQ